MSTLKSTLDRIKSLEAEKKSLLLEIDSLKKIADTKANTLEKEVSALRDEVKSLKIIIGPSEANATSEPNATVTTNKT